MADLSERDC